MWEAIIVFIICLCCFGAALVAINNKLIDAAEKNDK